MQVTYKTFKPENKSACADVLIAAYAEEPWNNTWTKKEATLRIETTMSGTNARGVLAVLDDQIIAMCLGRIDYYFSGWSQFCIDEFNVEPNHQSKGIGKQLLKHMKEELRKEGINQLFLITGGTQAASFYEQQGFVTSVEGVMMTCALSK